MRAEAPTAWVVYRMGVVGKQDGRNAVCTQPEWAATETARPGHHTLIRADIGTEGEAERLARDLQTPADPPKRKSRRALSRFDTAAVAAQEVPAAG